MKHFVLILTMAVLTLAGITAEAKKTMVPKMYMFGVAASFNDSIVCFTDVQEVSNAWIESKSGFLLDRQNYSLQLKEFLNQNKQLPHRTCIVYYNTDRTRLEKKYIKVRRLYTGQKKKKKQALNHFDVRFLNEGEFQFKALDASFYTDTPETKQGEAASGK